MCFVPVAQSLEDLDRVRDRRLGDLDGLEPALKRRVLLQVLAVLVQCRRADRLQLAAGQHRLEYRGRVDRALRGSSANQRVDLVDEQDDVPAGTDLLEHLLQPLFEIAAVARPGHQRAQVKGVELLVLERLWHLALDDALRQAFYHGRLADTGLALADQPEQNVLSADVIMTKLQCFTQRKLKHLLGPRRERDMTGRSLLPLPDNLLHLLAHGFQADAQRLKCLGSDALALVDEAKQYVLSTDVVVIQHPGLFLSQDHNPPRPVGKPLKHSSLLTAGMHWRHARHLTRPGRRPATSE